MSLVDHNTDICSLINMRRKRRLDARDLVIFVKKKVMRIHHFSLNHTKEMNCF